MNITEFISNLKESDLEAYKLAVKRGVLINFLKSLGFDNLIMPKRKQHVLRNDRVNWNIELCKLESIKYKTRGEWHKKSDNSYSTATRNGWLKECCTHMPESITSKKWTLKKCKEDALKYMSRKEWENNSNKTYQAATRNKWMDECTKHMIASVTGKKWTFEKCKEDALKYNARTEWARKSKSYSVALKKGWIEDCCMHMKPKLVFWTFEQCKEEASKCKTRSHWKKISPNSYEAARRNGWLDECLPISSYFQFQSHQIFLQ